MNAGQHEQAHSATLKQCAKTAVLVLVV